MRRPKACERGAGGAPFHYAPERLVAIDPGVAKCGVAYFLRGVLTEAVTLHRPSPADVAATVARWTRGDPADAAPLVYVRERMYYYPTTTARHGNLDRVEDWADALAEHMGIRWTRLWDAPTWKGPITKTAHHHRLRALLEPGAERWVWDAPSTGEDGRDAVGVGLYALRRVVRCGLAPPKPKEPPA